MQTERVSHLERWQLCGGGVLAAVVITLGLVVVRAASQHALDSWTVIIDDITREALTYGYVGGATLGVAVLVGWLLGNHTEYLERMSFTDPLTQLANRRGCMAVLHDELQRAARYHTQLTMMVLDLDNLKDINDGGGHEAGDLALRLVADSLRGTCRSTDLAARFGGDEFVVVAPSTHAGEALELANRIRTRFSAITTQEPLLGRLSLSVGIADLLSAGAPQEEALIAAADAALYHAKQAGRDRAVVARSIKPAAPCSVAVA